MPPREQIPSRVVTEILFINNHTCCVCRRSERDVQIHHIDETRSNNALGNLAVVCLDCHSRVTGRRGLGRSYTSMEVRQYKRSWERQVLNSRRIRRPTARYRKELISQIDLIVCEILSYRQNNPRVKELLNLLYELHLWRGNREIDNKIIEGLHHLAIMSGLGSPTLAGMVAEKLWEMCWHFVGPKDVAMNSQDLFSVLDCVDALGTLASFNSEFGHGREAILVIAEQMENFFEIGLWYSKRGIVNAVIREYDKALRGCYTDNRLEFQYGRRILRRSVRRLQKILREQQSSWRHQSRRLQQVLSI